MPPSAPHFVLTPVQMFNLGCEAIVRGTVAVLEEHFGPRCEISLLSRSPDLDRRQLRDRSDINVIAPSLSRRIRRWIWGRTHPNSLNPLLPFSPSDFLQAGTTAVLSIGGDEYTLPNGYVPMQLLSIQDACKDRDMRFVIWGATIEGLEAAPSHSGRLIEHIATSELITARDHHTVEYLKSLGVTKNVVRVFDPAFLMRPRPIDIQRWLPERRGEGIVGVNVSKLAESVTGATDLVQTLRRGVEAFIDRTGCSVVLVSHVFSGVRGSIFDDPSYHRELLRGLAPRYRTMVSHVDQNIGAPAMKFLISSLDAFAGARMHATVCAYSSAVPTLALAYSGKAWALNDAFFDHQRWVLPLASITPDLFSDRLLSLMDHRFEIRSELEGQLPEAVRSARHAGADLRRVVDS